jgi:hypothetical protein
VYFDVSEKHISPRIIRVINLRPISGGFLTDLLFDPEDEGDVLSEASGSHLVLQSIRSIEKFNDRIGNGTRDFPACSIVPLATTLPRTHSTLIIILFYLTQ